MQVSLSLSISSSLPPPSLSLTTHSHGSSGWVSCARPKLLSLHRRSLESSTFRAATSPCTNPIACTCASPAAQSPAHCMRWFWEAVLARRYSSRLPCPMCSSTRHTGLPVVMTPMSSTTCGWDSCARIIASSNSSSRAVARRLPCKALTATTCAGISACSCSIPLPQAPATAPQLPLRLLLVLVLPSSVSAVRLISRGMRGRRGKSRPKRWITSPQSCRAAVAAPSADLKRCRWMNTAATSTARTANAAPPVPMENAEVLALVGSERHGQ